MRNKEEPPVRTRTDSFALSKWYADCLSDRGETLIAYYGVARWKRLVIRYSSLLTKMDDAPVCTQYSIKKDQEPLSEGSTVRWHSRHLGFEGIWTAIDRGYSATLFSSADGVVEWQCLQPRGVAEIRWRNGQRLSGLGYVEHLRMNVAPWKLPIEELSWGHFLNCTDSLVWIDWRGPYCTSLLLHNGRPIEGWEATDNRVSFATSGSLTLGDSAVLREGQLGVVALAALSTVRKLLPHRILAVNENKWRSRARLNHPEPHDGWAIHEVVKWPRQPKPL